MSVVNEFFRRMPGLQCLLYHVIMLRRIYNNPLAPGCTHLLFSVEGWSGPAVWFQV